MQNQITNSTTTRQVMGRVLVAGTILLLLAALDASIGKVANCVLSAAQQTLVLLPSFVITAWQGLHSGHPGPLHFSLCSFESLVFWPLAISAAKLA